MDRMNSTRKSLSDALGWPKAKSRSALEPTSDLNSPLATSVPPLRRVPVLHETCIVLKQLVDFLIKSKLHKNDLFLLEAKPNERRKLLLSIQQGDLPEKLSQYSSRSVSSVVLELLAHSFTPLLPHECVVEFSRLEKATNSTSDGVECVVRSMRCALIPEQRALLESLLLLLYKLSLKATPQMNAEVLGHTVGVKLVSSTSTDSSSSQAATAAKFGRFLVENAPEILRQCRQKPTISTDLLISSRRDAPTRSSAAITDSYPAKAVPLMSAAAIIFGRQDAVSQPKQRLQRKLLDERTALGLADVLTAIIESNENKFGLYIGEESAANVERVKMVLSQGAFNSDQLLVNDPVTLSQALREFLREQTEPLLGDSVLQSLARNRSVNAVDSTRIVAVLEETIVCRLPSATQDVVLLLLATVRLALDAGTDCAALEHHLSPCLLPTSEDPDTQALAKACVAVLISEMHSVLRSLLKKREQQASARQLSVSLWVVYWVSKLRLKSQKRRPRVGCPELCTEEIEQSLCRAIEWLMDQTRVNPSQLRRLYLDAGDEGEVVMLVNKLSAQPCKANLANFSPFSLAIAVRSVLTAQLSSIGGEGKIPVAFEQLQRLLASHFDLLMQHEPLKRVRDELEQTLDEIWHCRATGVDGDACSDNNSSIMEAPVGDSVVKRELPPATAAGALSEWLLFSQCKISSEFEDSDTRPSRLPPHSYSSSALTAITDRLDDVLFVMQHSREQLTPLADEGGDDELYSLLSYLDIKPELIPRKRARATFDRIQATNHTNKVQDTTNALRALEIFETLVVETVNTLNHPALAALYPSLDDQLLVLLDIWGLADRSVTIKPFAPSSDFA